jgi:hypothetical protein
MGFKKFAIAALLTAGALASAPAHAATWDFTFLSNDTVLDINDGIFITDASNNIVSASGTLTSTDASLLGGLSSVTFSLAGLGAGTAGNQAWTNIYDPVANMFSGAGLGLLLSNGNYSSIYDKSGYAACPGQTCISIDPTSNSAYWDPGAAGQLTAVDPPDGVPEPASWIMMLIGFGGIGASLRATRKETATV